MSDVVPAGEAVFFRSFFAIPVIVVWLSMRGDLKNGLKTQRPMGHILRGLVGTAAMAMTFMGLGMLPLPEVTAIGYATPSPLLVVALCRVLEHHWKDAIRGRCYRLHQEHD